MTLVHFGTISQKSSVHPCQVAFTFKTFVLPMFWSSKYHIISWSSAHMNIGYASNTKKTSLFNPDNYTCFNHVNIITIKISNTSSLIHIHIRPTHVSTLHQSYYTYSGYSRHFTYIVTHPTETPTVTDNRHDSG